MQASEVSSKSPPDGDSKNPSAVAQAHTPIASSAAHRLVKSTSGVNGQVPMAYMMPPGPRFFNPPPGMVMANTPMAGAGPNLSKSPSGVEPARTPNNPPAPAEAPPLAVISYLTPKNILLRCIKAGIAKAKMTWWKTFLMAFMAGMYIGLGSLLMLVVMGGVPGLGSSAGVDNPTPGAANPVISSAFVGIQKLLGGCVFPVGLLLLVILGGELFTGNVMYVGAAVLARKVSIKDYCLNLLNVYFGNFVGSLFMAYFLAYLPEIVHSNPWRTFVQNVAVTKINYGWGVNFLRGIGCNWMVCAALFFALGSDELMGKIIALWWPIMAFITLGYEHCVANMFTIPIGLMEGADSHAGWFIAKNLIPVTLGNIVGGFVFLSLIEWVVFSEYFGEKLSNLDTRPGHKPEKAAKIHTLVAHPSSPHTSHFQWPHLHMPHWFHMPHWGHQEATAEADGQNNAEAQPPLDGNFDVEMGQAAAPAAAGPKQE